MGRTGKMFATICIVVVLVLLAFSLFGCTASGNIDRPAAEVIATRLSEALDTALVTAMDAAANAAAEAAVRAAVDAGSDAADDLPQPWGGILSNTIIGLLGGGGGTGTLVGGALLRERRRAIKIVKAVELAKNPEGLANFRGPNREIIDETLGPDGKRFVDSVQASLKRSQEAG